MLLLPVQRVPALQWVLPVKMNRAVGGTKVASMQIVSHVELPASGAVLELPGTEKGVDGEG